MTFTRGSIGTYNSSGNLLVTAGNDVARFNYVAGVSNLLIEGSATNIALQSNNLLASPWHSGGSSVATAAQFISPDGANNGWTFSNGTTAGFDGYAQNLTFTAATYTLSVWLKQAASISADLFFNGVDNVRTVSPTLTRISATAAAPGGSSYSIVTIVSATIPSLWAGTDFNWSLSPR
jgi:hypothetical protein